MQRRVRNKLQTATAGSDANELEKFMDQFQRHHLDDRGDYTCAVNRLEYLTTRRGCSYVANYCAELSYVFSFMWFVCIFLDIEHFM